MESLVTDIRDTLRMLESTTQCLTTDEGQHHLLIDLVDRFNILTGSIIGPHTDQNTQSLERRLSETPKLRIRLSEILEDMRTDLADLQHIIDSPDATDSQDQINSMYAALSESITALFCALGIAQINVTQDKYNVALDRVDELQVEDEQIDYDHVGEIFPALCRPLNTWLRRRLARANNHRRRYLQFCNSHQRRISSASKLAPVASSVNNMPGYGRSMGDDGDLQTPRLSSQKRRIELPQYLAKSFATVREEQSISMFGEPHAGLKFVCPYCKSEQSCETQLAWQRHVMADLRAYVCTREDCETVMFEDSHAWLQHELSEHLAIRSCPYCDLHLGSVADFETHMCDFHTDKFSSNEQLTQLATISVQEPRLLPASLCIFCNWNENIRANRKPGSIKRNFVTPEDYRSHIALHLEQVALFVLGNEKSEAKSTDINEAREKSLAFSLNDQRMSNNYIPSFHRSTISPFSSDQITYRTEAYDDTTALYNSPMEPTSDLAWTNNPAVPGSRTITTKISPQSSTKPDKAASIDPSVLSTARPLNRDEAWSFYYFESHALQCASCADPGQNLCDYGFDLARDVAKQVYHYNGQYYSTQRQEDDTIVILEIPLEYNHLQSLLKALDQQSSSLSQIPVIRLHYDTAATMVEQRRTSTDNRYQRPEFILEPSTSSSSGRQLLRPPIQYISSASSTSASVSMNKGSRGELFHRDLARQGKKYLVEIREPEIDQDPT